MNKNSIFYILKFVIITNIILFNQFYFSYTLANEVSDAYYFLNSKFENERLYALKVFIDNDVKIALPKILKLLNDQKAEVRIRASEAVLRLGSIYDKISVPALVEQISIEEDEKVLKSLLFSLASFSEDDLACMLLYEKFKKIDSNQQCKILNSMHELIKTNRRGFINLLELAKLALTLPDDTVRIYALNLVGEFGDLNYIKEWILKTLNDNNPNIRALACKYLGKLKPYEALNILIKLGLNDKVPSVRREAVIAVSKYNNLETFNFFKNILLNDIDATVRAEAALAFINLNDNKAIVPLKFALLDADKFVRLNAAYALTFFNNSDGQELLTWFLWEQHDPKYRRIAIKGLSNINSKSVINDLIRALSDWDDEVRDIAFETLRNKWKLKITQ